MKQQSVRQAALNILLKIEKNQAYSNLLLNRVIEKHEFARKDAALLTQLVYGTVQRQNTIDFYLQSFIQKNKKKIDTWVWILLRMAVYQMHYLERIPDRAVFYETVEIAKKRGHRGISGFVNGVLRSIQRQGLPEVESIEDHVERTALETSHPEWLVKRWIKQYGEDHVRQMCEVNNLAPAISARVNTARIRVEKMLKKLQQQRLACERGDVAPEAMTTKHAGLQHSPSFKEGLFTIQDESSMLAAHALDLSEGLEVLDACAAPGGKTTHIAELMNNTGSVTALDLHDHKVKLIQQQVKRLGLTNVATAVMDARETETHLQQASFDRILVDVPCSGFGVIRRKPDIKWGKSEQDICLLAKVQYDILATVGPLLKPGGKLVYSTCTIDKEENNDIVARFLKEHQGFSLDPRLKDRLPENIQIYCQPEKGYVQILPHYFNTDGFYIAALTRKEGEQ